MVDLVDDDVVEALAREGARGALDARASRPTRRPGRRRARPRPRANQPTLPSRPRSRTKRRYTCAAWRERARARWARKSSRGRRRARCEAAHSRTLRARSCRGRCEHDERSGWPCRANLAQRCEGFALHRVGSGGTRRGSRPPRLRAAALARQARPRSPATHWRRAGALRPEGFEGVAHAVYACASRPGRREGSTRCRSRAPKTTGCCCRRTRSRTTSPRIARTSGGRTSRGGSIRPRRPRRRVTRWLFVVFRPKSAPASRGAARARWPG